MTLLLVLLALLVLFEVLGCALVDVGALLLVDVELGKFIFNVGTLVGTLGSGGGASLGGAERGLTIGGVLFSMSRCDPSGFLTGC